MFYPTVRRGLRTLTQPELSDIHIGENELTCLINSSFALQTLTLKYWSKIIRLKIPCLPSIFFYLHHIYLQQQDWPVNAFHIYNCFLQMLHHKMCFVFQLNRHHTLGQGIGVCNRLNSSDLTYRHMMFHQLCNMLVMFNPQLCCQILMNGVVAR